MVEQNYEKRKEQIKLYNLKHKERLKEYQKEYRRHKRKTNRVYADVKNMTPDELKIHNKKLRRTRYLNKLKKQGKVPHVKLTDEEKAIKLKLSNKNRYLNKLKKQGKVPYVKKDPFILKSNYKKTRQLKNKNNPTKIYIIDTELTYQIILSQGKGNPTKDLYEMLYDISYNVCKRFSYWYEEDKDDVISECYVHLITGYKDFDKTKYKKSLPYITELIKRKAASYFKTHIINKGIKLNNLDRNKRITWVYMDYEKDNK